eukprot:CAMPEP_0119304534 /NCGR_PEP_ID=MMETSP1333-20130426/5733_1 /TAXON_ID=418940 /ORGANISM="Scyphosphaera apsteinii, Strain RCC1455" /LENGTH=198 /DNA_ID=CAMNT_0007307433 /DNA_START=26 /DNA_END=622 /DNA_ORIENTATION=+
MSRIADVLVLFFISVEALSPPACKAPRMSIGGSEMSSRRSAIAGAAVGIFALPFAARAQEKLTENAMSPTLAIESDKDYLTGNDDSIAAIARRTAETNRAAKLAAIPLQKTEADILAEKEEAKRNILLIGVGGTLASTAFFYRNLQRLFTKVISGGQDSGYGTIQDQKYRRGKKTPPPPPQKSAGQKLFRAFFGRELE